MADKYGVTPSFFIVTAERDRLARLAESIDTGKSKVGVARDVSAGRGPSRPRERRRPAASSRKTVLVVRD